MPCTIRASTGTHLNCNNGLIETAGRMVQNNLDPASAVDADNLASAAEAAGRRTTGPASTPSCATWRRLGSGERIDI